MWDRIIHPRLLSTDFSDLSDFFSSSCTIQEAAVAYDSFGGEVFTWGDLAGHVDIPCAIAPEWKNRETKAPDMTYVASSHHVTLSGCYDTIGEKMRAVVDGTAYDILLAEIDSQSVTTRLACQLVE